MIIYILCVLCKGPSKIRFIEWGYYRLLVLNVCSKHKRLHGLCKTTGVDRAAIKQKVDDVIQPFT